MGDRAALAIPTVDNRMIGFPYPKALNSNNSVDQASALIVASASAARALGVPLDRQVFVHAGTDGNDAPTMTTRPDLVSSPAIRIAGRRALDLAHLGPGEIEYVDLYSCFPSAVQIAARELGLSLERELTVTGGMSFAGAPWSSYTMHAVASMVALLRGDPTTTGLISANGGFLAKHSFGVYAARPPAAGFTHDVPQQQIDASYTARRPGGEYVGPARIEGYTVMHDRDGAPAVGLLALDVNGSSRTWGTTRRPEALLALESEEGVGRTVDLLAGGEAILST
jgi:acetyl-CoA C-acetyltransferase